MKKVLIFLFVILNIPVFAQAITMNCFGYTNGHLIEAEIAGIESLQIKERIKNPFLNYYKVWVRPDQSPVRFLFSNSSYLDIHGFINPLQASIAETNTLFALGDYDSYLVMSFDNQVMFQMNRSFIKRLELEKITNFESNVKMRCYNRE